MTQPRDSHGPEHLGANAHTALPFDSTKNNFDLLRALFALTVCLVHTAELSLFEDLSWIPRVFSAPLAVKAFFVVSGFLIFMSYERSRSLASYAGKRVRRIYPAYAAVIVLSAVTLTLVSSRGWADYFSGAWLKYLAVNLVFLNFLQPTLPGVFDHNPAQAVNGALWTLKIEVLFYASVPLFVALFRRFSILPVLLAAYLASVFFREAMVLMAERTGSRAYEQLSWQLPAQLAYFIAGAYFYYFLPVFHRHRGQFLIVAVALLLCNQFVQALPLLEPFAVATVVVFFGLYLYLGRFGKYGDFSYGIYIVHFPIIQLLLHTGWFGQHPRLFLGCAVFLTVASAAMLWNLVEKHFLVRRPA